MTTQLEERKEEQEREKGYYDYNIKIALEQLVPAPKNKKTEKEKKETKYWQKFVS